ncbi:two-component system response regulator YesN [Metabacillus crassostreae]|uniref:response regulator transcription factor n=1 Tax=Metabacillus crassostreae TaxID=929098 RepID=UPI00195ED576|nr:response regulator [Metabacillus crassostreae]MBM7605533.1 two-component system response regulator YesN [Metabacillus crassostreae]
MKKVFLVDDEVNIREGIMNSINWKNEGLVFCGSASDGEVALPLIEKHQPDIVITDIKMPFMDGLELSRILKERFPSIKIIILSGHDEFEYAREAMRIQITEYCLKPVSSQDLQEILARVVSQIKIEELENKRLIDLESQAIQNKTESRDKFLYGLCEGVYNSSDAIKKAANLNLSIISSYYYVVVVEATSESYSMDWIENEFNCVRFSRKLKESIFIMIGETKELLETESELIRKRLISHEENTVENSIIFGIGGVESRIRGISISFAEADEEKNYSSIIYKYNSKETDRDIESKKALYQFKRKDLIHFLKTGQLCDIHNFSRSYSSYLEKDNNRSPFITYYFLMDFTITITHYLKEYEIAKLEIMQEINTLEMKASWIRKYQDVLTYMADLLKITIISRDKLIGKNGSIIQKVKEYIHENYTNQQLSLQHAADEVNVNASYLSHLFSQETGHTFIEYLTTTRINWAKELLKTTNDKTYEIANKVGYTDSHYFCRTFKKVTGLTTRQYKNQSSSNISI